MAANYGIAFPERLEEFYAGVGGWYNDCPIIDEPVEGEGERWYPLAVNVVIKSGDLPKSNAAFWHESGHAWLELTGKVPKDRQSLYHRSRLIRLAARFGTKAMYLLWLFDREERGAETFARGRRNLQPIQWRHGE